MIKFYLSFYNLVVSPISSLRRVEEQDYGLELLNSLKERSAKAWHDYIEKKHRGMGTTSPNNFTVRKISA